MTKNAAGVMIMAQGKVLLLHRLDDDTWCFPGGHQEPGEEPENTALRECFEEIGDQDVGELKFWIRRIKDGVDFTTFVAKAGYRFAPDDDDEHDGHAWIDPVKPGVTLHPGVKVALDKLSMDELDIAEAMAEGELSSPQVYGNLFLFDIRITGTGLAYRRDREEFAWRDAGLYMTERFLRRCNGLPVTIDHPQDKPSLDTEEYRERAVGSVFLPYFKGQEVWAIVKIHDRTAAALMQDEQLSTSPGVVFREATSTNETIELGGGKALLIEGKPALLDHIAICEQGVWDKGGDPAGVNIEGITSAVSEMSDAGLDGRYDADALGPDEHWITMNGSHILIKGHGPSATIKGGAEGRFTGKTLGEVGGTNSLGAHHENKAKSHAAAAETASKPDDHTAAAEAHAKASESYKNGGYGDDLEKASREANEAGWKADPSSKDAKPDSAPEPVEKPTAPKYNRDKNKMPITTINVGGEYMRAGLDDDPFYILGDHYQKVTAAYGSDKNNGDTKAIDAAMEDYADAAMSKLSKKQHDAVDAYVEGIDGEPIYYEINEALRGKAKIPPALLDMARNIDSAVRSTRVPADTPVFRGFGGDVKKIFGGDPKDMIGKAFVHRSFASVTRKEKLSTLFGETIMQFTIPAGSPGLPVKKQNIEAEIILPVNGMFKIDKVESAGGKNIVHVTYLGSQQF